MDPQKLSQLDPKLREAYQRVMGTSIPQPQVAPIQAQTPPPPPMPTPDPTPNPAPEPEPIPNEAPAKKEDPTPSIQEPSVTQPEISPPPEPTASNFVQMNSEVAAAPVTTETSSPNFSAPIATPTQTIAVKKKNSMMPILILIGGLILLIGYAYFWIKIFNLKIPFL